MFLEQAKNLCNVFGTVAWVSDNHTASLNTIETGRVVAKDHLHHNLDPN